MPNVLITGGLGYIGSNITNELLSTKNPIVIIDNFSNSNFKALERLQLLSNKITFYDLDIRDTNKLNFLLKKEEIDSIIHLAGFKSVKESFYKSQEYIDNNLGGTISIVAASKDTDVKNIIFSSTAAVYSNADSPPFNEESLINPINPYGRSKLLAENYLQYASNYLGFSVVVLRYFNPLGSGCFSRLGEVFNNESDNIMPNILKTKSNKGNQFVIFGQDLPTRDGTPIRDYIHITDLANAHIDALSFLTNSNKNVFEIFNIGTGKGVTVLELLDAVNGLGYEIPIKFDDPRTGDPEASFATSKKAQEILCWNPKYSLTDMIQSSFEYLDKYYKFDK